MEKIINAKAADLEKLGLIDAVVRFEYVVEEGLIIEATHTDRDDCEEAWNAIPPSGQLNDLANYCKGLHHSMATSNKVGGSSRDSTQGGKTVGVADKPLLIQALAYVEGYNRYRP